VDATANPPSQLRVWQGQRLPLRGRPRASRRKRSTASSREEQHAPAPNAYVLTARSALLAVLIGATGHAPAQVTWQPVRGTDLHAILADHELADGVHYAYQFRAAGTFTGFNMGKELHGTWRLAGDEFCWTSAKRGAKEECFEVERRGASLRFLHDGYEAFSATVTPVKSPSKDEAPR
jgi:hypothetical protein